MTTNEVTPHDTSVQTAPAAGATPRITGMQKRVLAGGSVGQFIEFYDFALYGLSAVVLSQLFFPSESASSACSPRSPPSASPS